MKQKEKSEISKEKILNAAIVEFGTKSYDNASLNNICSDNNLSKGLIYHYFKNKDELYLSCVKGCFDELAGFLSKADYNSRDFRENIKKLLDLRYEFFRENPYYSNIFFNTVLQPPIHLKEKIKEIRKEFDDFNIMYSKNALKGIRLREGITEDEAVEYFFIFQEMYNGYFQSTSYKNLDFNTLIEDHELKLSKILNIILYGVAKEDAE